MANLLDPRNQPLAVSTKPQPVQSIVYYSRSVEDALATIRVLGPASQSGLTVIRGVENGVANPECVRLGDVVLLQRDFCVDLQAFEEILSLAHSFHKPVVFDIDDLLVELPENHPDRLSLHYIGSLLPVMRAAMEADLITVPTEALREYFLPYNPSIALVPNYLNDVLWQLRAPLETQLDDEFITIGYMGGHSHAPDLQLVLPALLATLEKYPHQVRYHFWGIQPPVELAPFSQVDWVPPNYQSYPDFVAYLQTQTADIMIAPLCDNLFNSCKSSIKYLEYGALGVPGVFSRVTPYINIVRDSEDGFLASTKEEWERALSALIENPGLRREMAIKAQEKIKKDWLLSKNAGRQLQTYTNFLKQYGQVEHSQSPFRLLIKSLTRQINDGFSSKTQQAAELQQRNLSLNDKLAELDQIISSQKAELAKLEQTIASQNEQLDAHKETITDLANQLAESFAESSKLKTELSINQFELSELRSELAERETEIISYVTSRSWQLTRPFRKLSRIINRRDNDLEMD